MRKELQQTADSYLSYSSGIRPSGNACSYFAIDHGMNSVQNCRMMMTLSYQKQKPQSDHTLVAEMSLLFAHGPFQNILIFKALKKQQEKSIKVPNEGTEPTYREQATIVLAYGVHHNLFQTIPRLQHAAPGGVKGKNMPFSVCQSFWFGLSWWKNSKLIY